MIFRNQRKGRKECTYHQETLIQLMDHTKKVASEGTERMIEREKIINQSQRRK